MSIFRLLFTTLIGGLLLLGMACGNGTYQLTTVVSGEGDVSPGSGTYAAGESVTLVASPADGWVFSYWGGVSGGSHNQTSVTIDSDKTVYAYFTKTAVPTPTPTPITLDFCSPPDEGKANIAGVLTWNGASWYETFRSGGVLQLLVYGDWLEIAGKKYVGGTVLARDSTDIEGYFCFRNIEPGEYLVYKWCPAGTEEGAVPYGPILAQADQTYWVDVDPYSPCTGNY